MPWITPTLKEARILTRDFITARMGSQTMVPNSLMRYLSDSNAGLAHLTMVYIDWLAKQLMPDTAETEWLDRFGQIWVGGRKDATYASGEVLLSGTPGTVVPAGSVLRSSAGLEYQTSAPVTLGNGATTPVQVGALSPGSLGNQAEGDVITFAAPIEGVSGQASVKSVSGGFERENDDSLRDRVMDRIRQPPHGGSANDYVQWARSVPGVTRAWAAMEMGLGTVTVRPMFDEDRAPYGLPQQSDLDDVAEYIDPLRPVSVRDVYVVAPVPRFITVAIGDLRFNDEGVRASIEANLKKMFLRNAAPGKPMYRSWIGDAVSSALREDHHELIFQTTHMRNAGELPVLQSVIYR